MSLLHVAYFWLVKSKRRQRNGQEGLSILPVQTKEVEIQTEMHFSREF